MADAAAKDPPKTAARAAQFLFERGAPAWVKVLGVEPDAVGGFKVSGSLRVVDQESGADLDPTGQLAFAKGARPPAGAGGAACVGSLPSPALLVPSL